MQNVDRPDTNLPAEISEEWRQQCLTGIRTKVDEADNDPRPSLRAEEVRRHFERRFRLATAKLRNTR